MTLLGRSPGFRIKVDGTDITVLVADRLLSLQVKDEEGFDADTFYIEIDNRDLRIAKPATGVTLKVWLGLAQEGLVEIGTFVVSRSRGSYTPATLRIEAEAAAMTESFRAPRTRAWRDVTLGELLSKVAGEQNLELAVAPTVAAIPLPFIAQTAESNLHLITRLAQTYGVIVKPTAGRLVALLRGAGETPSGTPIPELGVTLDACSSADWDEDEREPFASVEADWGDPDAGGTKTVTVGSGEPVRRLRHTFATQAEAAAAAHAEMVYADREVQKMSLDLARFEPDAFAGGRAGLSGFSPDHDGAWQIVRVTHDLRGTLTTSLELRRPKPD